MRNLGPAEGKKKRPQNKVKLLNLQILIAPESSGDYSTKRVCKTVAMIALNSGI
jgi:hypothetical protein